MLCIVGEQQHWCDCTSSHRQAMDMTCKALAWSIYGHLWGMMQGLAQVSDVHSYSRPCAEERLPQLMHRPSQPPTTSEGGRGRDSIPHTHACEASLCSHPLGGVVLEEGGVFLYGLAWLRLLLAFA